MTETGEGQTETVERAGKKPRVTRPGRLEIEKTIERGQVRQSFSHGRSKAVKVEVRRKRTFVTDSAGSMKEVKAAASAAVREGGEAFLGQAPLAPHLTEAEKAARVRALETAIREPAEAPAVDERTRVAAELEARRKAEEEARRRVEEEAPVRAEEEAKRRVVEEARRKAEEEASRRLQAEWEERERAAQEKVRAEAEPAKAGEEEEEKGKARPRRAEAKRPAPGARRGEARRERHRLTIVKALEGEETREGRVRSLAAARRAREREKRILAESLPPQKIVREVVVPETITIRELANRMAERAGEVVKTLMRMGVMATINEVLDADTAELVVAEFGHKAKRVADADVEIGLRRAPDAAETRKPRDPVVTIMGHVNHGKTSLLDALRETDVASREAGGITQHIGAYRVELESGRHITFIDTPGHEAFSAMRARGAKVTDIVVLVVAADDGIMPQTVEAISHARAAGVPIVVAVNKIDKRDADPTRVRHDLLRHDVVAEELGGEVLCVDISAKEKRNLDRLEEVLLLQAELLDLTANPDRAAEGAVIEARMERGRGSVATVLVQAGTLRVDDIFVAGSEWGRVRALLDDRGRTVREAGPSVPVEVQGLNGTPVAGDDFVAVESEDRAREVAAYRTRLLRLAHTQRRARGSLEEMLAGPALGAARELPVVLKADVQGSVEAIQGSLEKMSTDKVGITVLHAAVGGINESDVTLAAASRASIVGFNVRANPQARDLARREGVDIRYYSVIYDVTGDLKAAMLGLLSPVIRERQLGRAEVRQVFRIRKVGRVAGCLVTEGGVSRGAKVRLLRDNVVVHDGTLKALRRFKDEVREVREGFECGMAFDNYQDVQEGDAVECYELEEVAATL